jgi:hypothetical protein
LAVDFPVVSLELMGHLDVSLVITKLADLTLALLDGFGEAGGTGAEYGELLLHEGHVSPDGGGQPPGDGDCDACVVFIPDGQLECHLC